MPNARAEHSANVFLNIAQRLRRGFRIERERRTRARIVASTDLENDISAVIDNLTSNLNASSKSLGAAIGRIMFQLRELRLRYNPDLRDSQRQASNLGNFMNMAKALGVEELLDPVLFWYACFGFDPENDENMEPEAEDE